MRRIALIGCGAMCRVIVKSVLSDEIPGIELAAVAEVCPSADLRSLLGAGGVPLVGDPEKVLEFFPDLVIEAAEQEVVHRFAALFLRAKKDLIIMSVGALADTVFLKELTDLARERG